MSINNLREMHRRAIDVTGQLVGDARAEDMARATPCTGWNLRQLLAHMIGQNHGFADAVEVPEVSVAAFEGRDPVAGAWPRSAARVTEAFQAADLDLAVLLPELSAHQRFPVATVIGFHLLDTVVHGWDVAVALGRTHRPDDDLLAATLAQARLVPDGAARLTPGASFGPVLATDGDDWAQTLALLGRDASFARAGAGR
jgi:uncharacterized protein (TIGR03086 family)